MLVRTRIEEPDLFYLLERIDLGTVALPNFQRDFDWSDSDIRSLVATVLNGWPMGSLLLIPGDRKTKDFYSPRSFEFGPELSDIPDYIVLDGQQRLTSLYMVLFDKSPDVFCVRLGEDVDWEEIDSLDAAVTAVKRSVWERKYGTPEDQWKNRLLPIYALRSAADFYNWRDQTKADVDGIAYVSQLYREYLSGLHRYRVPCLVIDKEAPPAAVARIFERVNRTGRRLGVFDLMVAKTFSPTFNLRQEWEAACEQYPRLERFYGDEGTSVLRVISLRVSEDVRSNSVLQLSTLAVRDNWNTAVKALDKALEFAESRLGIVRADWVPYEGMVIVVGALAWDACLQDRSRDIESWFWHSVFAGRYAVGSNTTAVSDLRKLMDDPGDLVSTIIIDREALLDSTKQSNGAMHRAWLCALAAAFLEGGRGNASDLDAKSIVSRDMGDSQQKLHLRTLGFCLSVSGELIDDGPFLDGLTKLDFQNDEILLKFKRRISLLRSFLGSRTGVDVSIRDLES